MSLAGDWDMTAYFPEFDGEEYRRFRAELARDVEAVAGDIEALAAVRAEAAEAWASALERLEDCSSRSNHLAGYLASKPV